MFIRSGKRETGVEAGESRCRMNFSGWSEEDKSVLRKPIIGLLVLGFSISAAAKMKESRYSCLN